MARKTANMNEASDAAFAAAAELGKASSAKIRPQDALSPKNIRTIEAAAPVPAERKRVAAYARVSMETEELAHSLSAQVSYYSRQILNTPGWIYAGIFADEGISGTNMDRPEFQRLLAECEAGNVDIILTKSISRFARNTVDLLVTVRHLKELGVEVRFERENIRSLSEEGELMLTLLASFAQAESFSISENSKWSIRNNYAKGKMRIRAMYGYRVVDSGANPTGKELVIEQGEARVVRRIFRMYLEGHSCYGIAKELTREGIPSFRGTAFSGNVIAYMLRQEKYMGCTLCQKYFVESHITHREVRNNGELPMYFVEDTHPAIISGETFRAVQERLAHQLGVEIKNGIAGWGKRGYIAPPAEEKR